MQSGGRKNINNMSCDDEDFCPKLNSRQHGETHVGYVTMFPFYGPILFVCEGKLDNDEWHDHL